MQVLNVADGKPIKYWLEYKEDIEAGALAQAINLARLPFTFRHVALMPDVHRGMGMPIGGILATQGIIIPNAVGSDIGCGMRAAQTNIEYIRRDILENIIGRIKEAVPTGFKWRDTPVYSSLMPKPPVSKVGVVAQQYDRACRQLGTLGGGNHFIEIQKGDDGHIWLTIHSGSRNVGKVVGETYDNLAKKLNLQYYSSVPKSAKLAFLNLDTIEGDQYLREMEWCVRFSAANREAIMLDVKDIFSQELDCATFEEPIDVAHNYAAIEHHYKRNVVIHRKGATRARKGEMCIIPGCQGGASYIAKGLGNDDSFHSCSHGAGRVMGRAQARRELDLAAEQERLGDAIHSVHTVKDLDEAPSAYKDIDVVMINQEELITPIVRLTAIATVKG